ncbi:MAG: hypothetical protein WC799_03035, partial [Desulfobacteraceae bacterium]
KDKRGEPKTYELIRANSIHIVRHIKIRRNANPFDPDLTDYFLKRRPAKIRKPLPYSYRMYVASPVTCPNGINQKQPGDPARPKP